MIINSRKNIAIPRNEGGTIMLQYAKVSTVAHRFNVGEKTVRSWIKGGLIEASKPATGPTLINITSVIDYLSRCAVNETDADAITAELLNSLAAN